MSCTMGDAKGHQFMRACLLTCYQVSPMGLLSQSKFPHDLLSKVGSDVEFKGSADENCYIHFGGGKKDHIQMKDPDVGDGRCATLFRLAGTDTWNWKCLNSMAGVYHNAKPLVTDEVVQVRPNDLLYFGYSYIVQFDCRRLGDPDWTHKIAPPNPQYKVDDLNQDMKNPPVGGKRKADDGSGCRMSNSTP